MSYTRAKALGLSKLCLWEETNYCWHLPSWAQLQLAKEGS